MKAKVHLKLNKYDYLFLFVLFIAFLIRLNNFDYPLANQEIHVQHLVSSHIAKYKEFPLVGYFNGTFPSLGATPVYNYFLAPLILISDNIMFVGLVNFLLQIFAIFLLYIFAKNLFDRPTALISSLFISVSSPLITLAEWMWQPHIMFSFVTLSYLLLYLSYKKNSLSFLLISALAFSLSISLHMSVFTLLPIYLFTSFLILRNKKQALKKYLLSLLVLFSSLFIFYLPLIVHHSRLKSRYFFSIESKFVTSPKEYFLSLLAKTQTFFSFLFPNPEAVSFYFLLLILLTIAYFLNKRIQKKRKVTSLILFAAIISPIVSSAFINERFLAQHFTAAYGLFFILLAEFTSFPSVKSRLFRALSFILIGFIFLSLLNFEKIRPKPLFAKYQITKTINSKLSEEIKKIRQQEGFDNFEFFQFSLYTSETVNKAPGDVWFFETLLVVPLENTFNTKLAKIVENPTGYWYEITNSNDYIIVGCFGYRGDEKMCLEEFLADKENFSIVKNVVKNQAGYSFYLAKKGRV